MKKINAFYLLLVGLAVAMTAVVLFRDMHSATLQPVAERVDTVYMDTLYLTEKVVVHDTVYLREQEPEPLSPVENFTHLFREILKEELGKFYEQYEVLTEENIESAKAEFSRCEAAAKERYDRLVLDFTQKYPEEIDYINNWVSMEMTRALKPYLHMLSDYGNRKSK